MPPRTPLMSGSLQKLHKKSKSNHTLKDSEKTLSERTLKDLQLKMLRIQQGLYFTNRRAVILIEGFDASGKGGTIRRLTSALDPRSFRVHPIGPPDPIEQGKHWLYRFWAKLPAPGNMTIFDRSWYGRVLVERVDELTSPTNWKRAYREIRQFEELLTHDGIDLVKIYLGISKGEQLLRFQERIENPYKQWKIQRSDIDARKKWNQYVKATDDLFRHTHTSKNPWHLIATDDKSEARLQVLKTVVKQLAHHLKWMEKKAHALQRKKVKELSRVVKKLK